MPTEAGKMVWNHASTVPSQIIIMAIVASIFFFVLTVLCCVWYGFRRVSPSATAPACASNSSAAVNGVVHLYSLPTFVYTASDGDENPDCAICLTEFKDGEQGRLLPRCLHSFHAECIDVWFLSQSTCPLCRSTVEAIDVNFEELPV